jgi:Rha family phage regulatory protein
MKEFITTNLRGIDILTSLFVAEAFSKNHNHICRTIRELSCSDKFRASNFVLSFYISAQGKKMPMFEMTKDGFSMLPMRFIGQKEAFFIELIFKEFNDREELLMDDDYIIRRAKEILDRRMEILKQSLK